MKQLSKKRPMYFEFNETHQASLHFHDDVELFYVFSGEIQVELDDESFVLKEDDFMIINVNKQHRFFGDNNALTGSFHVDYFMVSELMNQTYMIFWCNTIIDKSSAYDDVRKTIKALVKDYFENIGVGKIRFIGLYYELLYQMTKHFLVSSKDAHEQDDDSINEERIMEITKYVAINFRDRLSLNTLSESLYLSESYLSKYIKRKFGMNFIQYVNNVRLNHALSDLLYEDKSITRIAMENGFANVGTFNRVFKLKYNMPPKAYKASLREKETEVNQDIKDKLNKRIEAYISNNPAEILENNKTRVAVNADVTCDGRKYKKVWREMINAGTAIELLGSNLQEHIVDVKQHLKFKHIRIWDLYSPEMYIDINAKNHYYNFDKLNRVLDVVVDKGLYPYLELSIKPKQLLKTATEGLIMDESTLKFNNLEILKSFISALTRHLIDRYTIEQLENWVFELWKEEADVRKGVFTGDATDFPDDYLKRFAVVSKTMKSYIPNVKIGGAGLSIRYGKKSLTDFLKLWHEQFVLPDFLTFYCYPYVIGDHGNSRINKMSTDRDYLMNYISTANEVLRDAGFSNIPVHITEWNLTVSNRNVLNDSCYKGAFVMKNLIQVLDCVDLIGYWFASDMFADYYDSNKLLNGSSGLLSKDGIAKPVYYAFDFLNRLGSKLISKSENYMITDAGFGETRIVCHNYKFLNHHYFMKHEDEVDIYKLDMIYEDLNPLTLDFDLEVEASGHYEIKIYGVNQQYGSVQDEWVRMACPENLLAEEIKYLKQVCVPRLTINHKEAKNNKLNFSTILEPNEIQLIQIKLKYQ